MKYDPNIHRRRSLRLKNYNYSQSGLYFITVCTQDRIELFGEIKNGKMILNDYGRIIQIHWQEIPKHYPDIKLLEYVIMPNHIHGILWFTKYIGDPNPLSPNDKNFQNVGAIHELPLQIHKSPRCDNKKKRNQKIIAAIWHYPKLLDVLKCSPQHK